MSSITRDADPDVRRRAPRWVPAAVAVGLVATAFFGVRALRTRSANDVRPPAAAAPGMPTSAAMESTYGIRFDAVVLTADDGIVELRYTVLDQSKANLLHDTQPWIGLADGTKLDQPGIAGHGGHSKNSPEAGRGGYLLLANSKSAITSGAVVTVHVGDVSLAKVPVQG